MPDFGLLCRMRRRGGRLKRAWNNGIWVQGDVGADRGVLGCEDVAVTLGLTDGDGHNGGICVK